MIHVFNPIANDVVSRNIVHALAYKGAPKSLCSLMKTVKVIDGVKYPNTYEVDRPITCNACTKAMELTIRHELTLLSAANLEELLDQIAKMRAA